MINYKCTHKRRVSFVVTPRTAPSLHSKRVSITQCDNCRDEERDKRYFLLKVKSELFHIPWISCLRISWNMGKKASSNEVTAFESAAQTILKKEIPKYFYFGTLIGLKGHSHPHKHISCFCPIMSERNSVHVKCT
jgi:hypothetical protein